MPDPQNPGQFGNRDDTEEQAQKGGKESPGKFGSPEGATPPRPAAKVLKHSPPRPRPREADTAVTTGNHPGDRRPGHALGA
jgi:hypothetical protein